MRRKGIYVGLLTVASLCMLLLSCHRAPIEQMSVPGIDVEKSTNGTDADDPPGPIVVVGSSVTWQYVVTNTGDPPLSDVVVTDDAPGVVPVYRGGDDGDDLLEAGETWIYDASGVAIEGQYRNAGTASATGPEDETVADTDSSHYFGTRGSCVAIEVTTNGHDADMPPGPILIAGDPVTWEYTVRNTGDSSIVDVVVTDNIQNVLPVYKSGDDGDEALEPGEIWIYTAGGEALPGQYANIGTVLGNDPGGAQVTDSDSSHYYGILDHSQEYSDTLYSVVVSAPLPADITLPSDKLPWPHQPPGISQPVFYQLVKDIWLFNNYGRYNSNLEGTSMYFHDGIDVMLDNGTKMYAVDSGTVVYTDNRYEYYWLIMIEDDPGFAWSYVHVNNFQFQVGDFVQQGDYIADINFHGMPHVHLERIQNTGGPWDDYSNVRSLNPEEYFLYEDTEAPIIKTPFYYFHNNSNAGFENTRPAILRGDVDIVVGMREAGECHRSKDIGLGDRNCIARIEYTITGEAILPVHKQSFDFTEMAIQNRDDMGIDRVKTVFKHWNLFHTSEEMNSYSFWDKTFSYYIITNTPGTVTSGLLDVNDQDFAWNTAAVDWAGNRLFPNGLYTVTVWAYDFLGNYTVAKESVIVDNP